MTRSIPGVQSAITPAVSLLLLLLTSTLHAGQTGWTRFRGPNGTGVSSDAFDRPITDSDFAWKVDLPGEGHSSPVIWHDRLFITSGDPETADRIVMCLKIADGSTLWKKVYHSNTYQKHKDNSYASSTPAVDETGVYVCWTTPKQYILQALDHDGKELWKQDLGGFACQHGSGASPIVAEGRVIVANDQEGEGDASSLNAFDCKTGKPAWTLKRPTGTKAACSTPCLYEPAQGRAQLIISCQASGVTSVDPATGKVNWSMGDILPMRTVGSPIIADGLIIATCGEGAKNRVMVAITPPAEPSDEPKLAYKLSQIPPYVPTPLCKDGLLYLWGDSGTLNCVKAATGEKIWSEKVGGTYYGSPACAGSTLWTISRQGELIGVSASNAFHLVGKVSLGEPSNATPSIAEGRMFLRTAKHLICVGGK